MEQHQRLMDYLKADGWQVDDTPHIVVLGALGAVYCSGQQALQKLGLSKGEASALLEELSLMAIDAAYGITITRRQLEGRCRARVGVG